MLRVLKLYFVEIALGECLEHGEERKKSSGLLLKPCFGR